jgi:hypothetical protein
VWSREIDPQRGQATFSESAREVEIRFMRIQ